MGVLHVLICITVLLIPNLIGTSPVLESLFQIPYSGIPVPDALFWMPCSGIPVPGALFWNSCSRCPVLDALFWNPCSRGPVLEFLFQMPCSRCLVSWEAVQKMMKDNIIEEFSSTLFCTAPQTPECLEQATLGAAKCIPKTLIALLTCDWVYPSWECAAAL